MELIEGCTLRQRITEEPLTLREAIEIAVQVAKALIAAHAKGVIHRDIKPENIMLNREGVVKVLDFGIAVFNDWQTPLANQRVFETNLGGQATGLHYTWKMMGTISYMSPEQTRRQETNSQTDIWSLGVVLYEIISGELPFRGETTPDVQAAILKTEPRPLLEYVPEAPVKLGQIVNKMLGKKIDERYRTSQEALADLQELLNELEKAERFPPTPAKKISSKYILILIAVLALTVLIGVKPGLPVKVSSTPQADNERTGSIRPRANVKDLSDTYGIVDNKTIFNKKTRVVFAKPQEFFADSGMTSFENLKFDEVPRLPSDLRFVNGKPLRPEGSQALDEQQ
jgi:serine/threonine-protein kinase